MGDLLQVELAEAKQLKLSLDQATWQFCWDEKPLSRQHEGIQKWWWGSPQTLGLHWREFYLGLLAVRLRHWVGPRLDQLVRSEKWTMDGTFDSAPYPFKQVFCISVVSASGRIVPVLWALLNSKSKTKKMYREGVFRPLYNLLVERNNGNAFSRCMRMWGSSWRKVMETCWTF